MSDGAEKPFEPTPSRLEKARREGNVARAGELSANAAFAGAIAGTIGCAAPIAAHASLAIRAAATGNIPLAHVASIGAWTCLPLAAAALGGISGGLLQTGGPLFVAPAFRFERFNPVEGFKRICSRETSVHAMRSSLAFTAAVIAMVPILALAAAHALPDAGEVRSVAGISAKASIELAATALSIGVIFGIAEILAARRSWLGRLRMTLDERRRELKEQEGNPATRGRRRSLHRSLVRGSISSVKSAALVVANPTHVAVALEYRPPEVPVPRVLVRAAGEAAARVRALAAELRIPVVENVALARALYASTNAGDFIPVEHYAAVAAIVARL